LFVFANLTGLVLSKLDKRPKFCFGGFVVAGSMKLVENDSSFSVNGRQKQKKTEFVEE
jgi:hypothetical protein